MTETITYRVPTWNLVSLTAALGKLATRAARLHVELPTWSASAPYLVTRGEGASARQVEVADFTVSTAPVRLAGWQLAGTLDFDLGATPIVNAAPGITLPATYQTADAHCDHCGYARKRTMVVLLQHEDGRFAQVGRQCVSDFLGHDAAQLVARADLASAFATTLAGAEDEGWIDGPGYRTRPYLNLGDYLAWVAATIRCIGWVSRKQAKAYNDAGGHRTSTSEFVLGAIYRASIGKREKDDPVVTEADRETAAAAIAWAAELEPVSDYDHNLHALATAGVTTYKHAGLAASIVASHLRHLDQLAQFKRNAEGSAHVGTVGAREVLDLICHGTVRTFEGGYGVTSLLTFVTPEGHVVKWFCSGEAPSWFDDGTAVRLRVSIVKHGEFKGRKETQVARARIEPTEAEQAAKKAADRARAAWRRQVKKACATHQLVCPRCGHQLDVIDFYQGQDVVKVQTHCPGCTTTPVAWYDAPWAPMQPAA